MELALGQFRPETPNDSLSRGAGSARGPQRCRCTPPYRATEAPTELDVRHCFKGSTGGALIVPLNVFEGNRHGPIVRANREVISSLVIETVSPHDVRRPAASRLIGEVSQRRLPLSNFHHGSQASDPRPTQPIK